MSELVSLNRGQVDLERREFAVRGKGSKPRIVFVSERCVHWIKLYLAERQDVWEPLFISYGRNREDEDLGLGEKRRLTAYTVQTVVRGSSFCRLGKKVTPHVLRHSFATELFVQWGGLAERAGHAGTRFYYDHSNLYAFHQFTFA